ncbi:MAG: CDP-diacylglycerol--serine O-phosphatidyltransferase [Bacteroidales bacterium]|jgi:CDP-diacylglycerol--serine O-phosphatidyltransferase|nr:CDP-diacylglycerol--serine O-phosphatidyltransferase [Bacteroidales bacterium]MDY0084581.1 CDP-diacylglycerol--serine O-phosphatidyltransferase [Bacteroidales bacterium]
MKLIKFIPNLITLLNLFSGILAIYCAIKGDLNQAAYFIFIAALFDFLDGFAARLLKAYSGIGEQLDSLADVVSFGVAPAFILHELILISHGRVSWEVNGLDILPFVAFMVPLFAAYRLAKFNVDESQTVNFKGLPSPAAGLMIASLPLIRTQLYEGQSLLYMVLTNTYFYIGIALIVSVLMVSNLPLFGLKFKKMRWKGNEIRWFFLLVSLVLILLFQALAIPFIILLYLFLSLVVFLADIQQ